MFPCFKCESSFASVDCLITHLKYHHLIPQNNNLICKVDSCNQLFSNYKSFKLHLTKTHSRKLDNSNKKSLNVVRTQRNVSRNEVQENNFFQDISQNLAQNSSHNFDVQQLVKSVKKQAILLTMRLHSQSFMPRSEVRAIQNMISNLMSYVTNTLKMFMGTQTSATFEELDIILSACSSPFDDIRSEHRLLKQLTDMHIFHPHSSFVIQNTTVPRIVKGNCVLSANVLDMHVMPIKFQIKSFFELPNILNVTIENQKTMQNHSSIINFVNSDTFANKLSNFSPNDIVIPYFLYCDDFQINNALGTHVFSICAFYYSFPTIPQHLLSKLNFIFPCAYISSKALKCCDYDTTLCHLVRELKDLENGIEITTSTGPHKVFFILGLILGDNLGLNKLLGFVQSFNADKFCRACSRSKHEMKVDVSENSSFLRNKNTYDSDLQKNNVSETGIRTVCIFSELQNFHVVENFYFDLMHDILEGVCVYDICHILLALIDNKILSIEIINNRKNLFNIGEIELGNSSVPIDLNRLKKNNLKMTASEALSFLHFMPLMLGDLVPEENRHWQLLIKLIEIKDLLFETEYTDNDLNTLRDLIRIHHELYIDLCGPLKPKHHFMVHYPTAIKKCGPLKYAWVMRFEGKHKEAKAYFNNITSRQNPSHSLATKMSLKFSNFLLLYENGFPKMFEKEKFTLKKVCEIEHLKHVTHNLYDEAINITYDVIHKGISYKTNYYLGHKKQILKLYKILFLFYKNETLYVVCNEIELKNFSQHFQSFEIGASFGIAIEEIAYFTSYPMHIYTINNGKTYLRYKSL